MKKILALLLLLALLLPAAACAADEPVIINKIKDPENPFTFPEDAKLLEIYFPRIDDCDAAFIRYGEYTMLLDCAGEQWERVKSMLNGLGVTELTYAFNSHPHTDHIFGFHYIAREIPMDSFVLAFDEDYLYANDCAFRIYDELHSMEVPFRRVGQGDTIDFGDVKMTVFQHWDEEYSGNNNSASLKIEYGDRSFLFAADIQRDGQMACVNAKDPLKADVLKAPHHGYNNMQYSFLKAVDPELVVITSASGFANGVQRLKEYDYHYYFTQYGVMRFTTDGNVWVLERFK